MATPKVTFTTEVVTVDCRPGQTIREVAKAAGIELERGLWRWGNCRGLGLCGACKVWVRPRGKGAVSEKDGWERSKADLQGSGRLGCRARIFGDVEVTTLPGGPPVRANMEWKADDRPSRWKDRTSGRPTETGAEAEAADDAPATPAE